MSLSTPDNQLNVLLYFGVATNEISRSIRNVIMYSITLAFGTFEKLNAYSHNKLVALVFSIKKIQRRIEYASYNHNVFSSGKHVINR